MRNWSQPLLIAVTCLSVGTLMGTLMPSAQAQDSTIELAPPSTGQAELLCKTFKVTPDDAYGGIFETTDTTDPVGQWVQKQTGAGWSVHSVDLEFATKGTGFPVAYNQICLSKAR
ncbi:MAG: hypothetical protein ACI9VR_003869 [Cognaticolwellia sp.]|jgi:hypothetical protein